MLYKKKRYNNADEFHVILLPNDKISGLFKLREFADDNLNLARKLESLCNFSLIR